MKTLVYEWKEYALSFTISDEEAARYRRYRKLADRIDMRAARQEARRAEYPALRERETEGLFE